MEVNTLRRVYIYIYIYDIIETHNFVIIVFLWKLITEICNQKYAYVGEAQHFGKKSAIRCLLFVDAPSYSRKSYISYTIHEKITSRYYIKIVSYELPRDLHIYLVNAFSDREEIWTMTVLTCWPTSRAR